MVGWQGPRMTLRITEDGKQLWFKESYPHFTHLEPATVEEVELWRAWLSAMRTTRYLARLLQKYGQHRPSCALRRKHQGATCTCGWTPPDRPRRVPMSWHIKQADEALEGGRQAADAQEAWEQGHPPRRPASAVPPDPPANGRAE